MRSSNPVIAKWQSAVMEAIKQEIGPMKKSEDHLSHQRAAEEHPMVVGMNLFVAKANGKQVDTSTENIKQLSGKEETKEQALQLLHANIAEQLIGLYDKHGDGVLEKIKSHDIESLVSSMDIDPSEFPYSDYAKQEWIIAGLKFLEYGDPYPSPYINVHDHGGPESDFSVYTIQSNSKIAILGDFGTGLDDATSMLIAMLEQLDPDIIIHLGDIYYSGTEEECKTYCAVFKKAFEVAKKTVPVFSLPGNHEYMSGGTGYFNHARKLNSQINPNGGYHQKASYFSLRTDDGNWQFLGMDTGYNSMHVHTWQLMNAYGPWLEFNEAAWHQNKLNTWKGKNILLSHHQLFSAYDKINDGEGVHYQSSGPKRETLEFFNGNLDKVFSPYYSKISAWFWGHEHDLCILENDQAGLKKGRLVGGSGYEEASKEIPKGNSVDDSPYRNTDVRVDSTSVPYEGTNFDFLNHGFALITLSDSDAMADYFQYPITSITSGFKALETKSCEHLFQESLE